MTGVVNGIWIEYLEYWTGVLTHTQYVALLFL